MEITIQKRVVFINLVLIGLVAVGVWVGPHLVKVFYGYTVGSSTSTPTPDETFKVSKEDTLARAAAQAGAQAFYSVDYQKGQQAWLDQLCAASTQMGCTIYQNVIVPALWDKLLEAKTVTSVQVSVQDKVLDQVASTRGNAPIQVWRLQIQLSAPWPVQATPQPSFSALALVIKENGAWKFERFLTEDELQVYAGKDSQK